jgi:inner membrane protein
VDALSHALITVIIFLAAGSISSLIPFAVIGAVIVDADIFFRIISDRDPDLYIFTHGGFAHSIPGAVVVSGLGTSGILLAVLAGAVPAWVLSIPIPLVFFAILAGAGIHLGIDALAYPDIPLLYPLSDSRVTLGILPGPSIFLFITTSAILVARALGQINTPRALAFASAVFILFLVFRALLFLFARQNLPEGRRVPLPNPLHWIIIGENETAFLITRYSLFRGISGSETFEKYINTDLCEADKFQALPEVRRLKFHSYITVAEKPCPNLYFQIHFGKRAISCIRPITHAG